MVLFSVFVNVNGCSVKVLSISVKSLAEIATLSLEFDSISILLVIVDSRSDELIVRLLLSISNKKLSRIGMVFDEFITPLKI